jgi:hypothetical protein
MTLPELQACLNRLEVRLSAGEDRLHYRARRGVLTPEIKAALARHKPALLVMLASPTRPAPEPKPPGCFPPRPIPAPRVWHHNLWWWPVFWRQRWADRVAALLDAGKPWKEAERRALQDTIDEVEAAEAAGGAIVLGPPAPSDDEAAIHAFLPGPLDDRTSWAELIESGRRHNEYVLSRHAAKVQAPETPVPIPDPLQQLTMFK